MARPYVITIASEKGGVGKTTLATNLAIYLKGLSEDTSVTIFSLDNHFTIDQMFALDNNDSGEHIGDVFRGSNLKDLSRIGQYGVNYIPSSTSLVEERDSVLSTDQLAQALATSDIDGIVIIDTYPVLDQHTYNAIHAADRVIVPIKDAPSLENSRHLADFVTQSKRKKGVMKILPCLIDTRIHFDGPFRNTYQLLKAYAINRGYRCYEGYIAKSPKVETLGTNPDGKVYPIITHARNTDVHLQMTHLARQVYLDYLQYGPQRIGELAHQRYDRDERLHHQYLRRCSNLQKHCLCCGKELDLDKLESPIWYIESSQGKVAGFVEDECFFEMLLYNFYPQLSGREQQKLLRDLLKRSTGRDYLLLQRSQQEQVKPIYAVYRLDQHGHRLAERKNDTNSGLFRSRKQKTLEHLYSYCDNENSLLLAGRLAENPLSILEHIDWMEWQTVFNRALIDLNGDDQ